MYYRKSMAENTTGGIKYESVLAEAQRAASQYQNTIEFDTSIFSDGVDPFATPEVEIYESTNDIDDYQI